eukprot:gene23559-28568_t
MEAVQPILTELSKLVEHLVPILQYLQKLASSNQHNEDVMKQLIEGRQQIVEGIWDMNMMLWESNSLSADNSLLYLGKVVLLDKLVCKTWKAEYAIVIGTKADIETSQDPYSNEKEDKTQLDDASLIHFNAADEDIFVVWVQPTSKYELFSQGCETIGCVYHKSKLLYADAHSMLTDYQQRYMPIQEGTTVQCYDFYRYQWFLAQVVMLFYEHKKIHKVQVRVYDYVKLGLEEYKVVDYHAMRIRGMPNSELSSSNTANNSTLVNSSTTTNNTQQRRETYNSFTSDSKYADDIDEDDGPAYNQDGIKTLPSYVTQSSLAKQQANNNNTTSAYNNPNSNSAKDFYASIYDDPSLHAASVGMGVWERHTKKVGSRLLSKMGYQRGFGKGLGKEGQGRLQPVETNLVPLPPGLSLDYIKEFKEKQESAPVPSSSSQKKKDNPNTANDNTSTSFFDLLNKVEAQPNSLNNPCSTGNNASKKTSTNKAAGMMMKPRSVAGSKPISKIF